MGKRTFVMCKPDAVERGLVGEIVARLERKGLAPGRRRAAPGRRARSPRSTTTSTASKPFYGELVDFLTRSPVFAMVVEGPDDDTWELCRILIGKTKVTDAQPGSIRGDLATTTTENLVHGSDGPEAADRELELWFPGESRPEAEPRRSVAYRPA